MKIDVDYDGTWRHPTEAKWASLQDGKLLWPEAA